jgi:polyisoprenoid-binding protein YceI
MRVPISAALLLTALGMSAPAAAQDWQILPPQRYTADPNHMTLVFTVNHLGFSEFTASFDRIDATLDLDVNDPAAARLSVTIPAGSLDLPFPGNGFLDTMLGETWLNAAAHPDITFVSTAVTLTGDRTADITGDLTLRGVTRPVTLQATFNGGYAQPPWEPYSRLGFSATGTILRSDFGMDFGIPAPGTTLGVSDAIALIIESEFIGDKAP